MDGSGTRTSFLDIISHMPSVMLGSNARLLMPALTTVRATHGSTFRPHTPVKACSQQGV